MSNQITECNLNWCFLGRRFQAHRSYRDAVVGMRPRDDMDISLYIEPQTGVILQALQMVQVNAMVHSNPNFPELANLQPEVFLPVGYINTSIYVDSEVAKTLIGTLLLPEMSAAVAAWLLVTASSISLLVLLIQSCARRWCRQALVVQIDDKNPLLREEDPQTSGMEQEIEEEPPGPRGRVELASVVVEELAVQV